MIKQKIRPRITILPYHVKIGQGFVAFHGDLAFAAGNVVAPGAVHGVQHAHNVVSLIIGQGNIVARIAENADIMVLRPVAFGVGNDPAFLGL